MKTGPALAACVALAVGAHAALLMQRSPGELPSGKPAGGTVSLRLQAADHEAEAPPPPPLSGEQPASTNAAPATPSSAATVAEEAVPSFDGGVPSIGFPDAPLPEGGARVRAYLVLDPHGATQSVVTAAPPELPAAYQKVTATALRQARLQPGQAAAYCLLASFDANATQARLAWLPGAAQDADRCLAGALPAPREILVAAEAAP